MNLMMKLENPGCLTASIYLFGRGSVFLRLLSIFFTKLYFWQLMAINGP